MTHLFSKSRREGAYDSGFLRERGIFGVLIISELVAGTYSLSIARGVLSNGAEGGRDYIARGQMAGGISTGDKWLGSFHQGADGWRYFTKG